MRAEEYQNIFKKHAKERIDLLERLFFDFKKKRSSDLLKKIKEEIHSFVGTSSIVDYPKISLLCQKIEEDIRLFEDIKLSEDVLMDSLNKNLSKLTKLLIKIGITKD